MRRIAKTTLSARTSLSAQPGVLAKGIAFSLALALSLSLEIAVIPARAGGELQDLPIPLPAVPRAANCHEYAASYANSYLGSGDPNADIVDNAMSGAVQGGALGGPGLARRGAVAGGAQAVLDNLASYPGGWQALYDMAYNMCRNETSSVTHRPSTLGNPSINCKSRAEVLQDRRKGILHTQSGCR